jgi:general secretion pathway protein L
MKSIGIDIGSSSIKIVEVQQTNRGLQIVDFREHLISQNPGFDPALEIIEFLRTLSHSYDPTQVRFVVGLRQDRVAVRNKIFPFNDRNKILKSLPFELEEDLPFSSESAIFDAKIVRILGNSSELLACAVPKNRVQEMLAQMKDANIDVSVLSSEAIAFANCFENWNAPIPSFAQVAVPLEGEPRAARNIHIRMHLGHTRTLVTAFEGDILIGVRSLLWGGKNIAEAIVKKYEIPFIDALKELQTKGFVLTNKDGASYDQIVFSDTISAPLHDLGHDLKITLLEFQSEFNGHVDGISVTGGVSQLQNINAFITQMVEVPVNSQSVLGQVGDVQVPMSPHTENAIAIALGLAIEGLKKPRNPPVNFLKGEFAKQNKKIQELWETWGSAVRFATIVFFAFWVYSISRDIIADSLTEKVSESVKVAAQKAGLPKKSASEAGIKRYIQQNRKKITDLKVISNLVKMNSAMDVLKKISETTPGKNSIQLTVKRLQIIENRVEIEGTVAKPQELSTLLSTLQSASLGAKLNPIKNTFPNIPGTTPFAYSFTVDRNIQKAAQ